MKKLNALRQQLIDAVPDLRRDPDRLLAFVEDGSIEFARGPNLSHGYAYTAQLVLTDYADEIDAVVIPLLDWLSIYQPDLDPKQAVAFEAEILNNSAVDLAIRVQLTERVVAKRDCATGQIHAEHRMPRFEPDDCPAEHWQLLLRDSTTEGDHELIAEWDGPRDGL
ncbi:phage tail protein [Salinicola aestuarinus]|uniref:phage tail protein n=1 Tax=Salinicola aestuarinus TaxID=1949082 RepID=UPI000DA20253|nr:phage tail protein [Salinicola aestuarinus]